MTINGAQQEFVISKGLLVNLHEHMKPHLTFKFALCFANFALNTDDWTGSYGCRQCEWTVTVQRCYGGLLRPCSGPRQVHEVVSWCFRWHWRSGGHHGIWQRVSSSQTPEESDWWSTYRRRQSGDSHQAPQWCLSLQEEQKNITVDTRTN